MATTTSKIFPLPFLEALKTNFGTKIFCTLLFFLLNFAVYESSIKKIDEEIANLSALKASLESDIENSMHKRKALQSALYHRNEKKVQEMVLKSELGMVEKGEIKLMFEN